MIKDKDDKPKPWETHPHIWSTVAKFMSFVRGGIRKSLWQRHPVKLEFIKNNRKRIPNPNPNGKVPTVWGGECYLCGNDFAQKDLQVDHLKGNHSLKSMDDLQSFVEAMLFVEEEDLALVCVSCHKIKSYAERTGITFNEAKVQKIIIEMMKDKRAVDELLRCHNLPCNNDKTRKESLECLLKKSKK